MLQIYGPKEPPDLPAFRRVRVTLNCNTNKWTHKSILFGRKETAFGLQMTKPAVPCIISYELHTNTRNHIICSTSDSAKIYCRSPCEGIVSNSTAHQGSTAGEYFTA